MGQREAATLQDRTIVVTRARVSSPKPGNAFDRAGAQCARLPALVIGPPARMGPA